MKTNVLLRLKTDVYEHASYLATVRKLRTLNPDFSFYGPLRRLSHLVSLSIFTALVSAGLQFTLGLSSRHWAGLVCVSIGLSSVLLVAVAWGFLWLEISRWLARCEADKAKEAASG